MIKITNDKEDMSCYDRILAILIADNTIYYSDCDHQDCFEQYCQDKGISSGLDWSNPDTLEATQEKAENITCSLFKDTSKKFYGFDVFGGLNGDYIVSHFKHNLLDCDEGIIREMLEEVGVDDYQLATFDDEGGSWKATICNLV